MPTRLTHSKPLAAFLLIAALAFASALAGCGETVDPALVTSAGKHGDALEANYSLLTKKILEDASVRDLKDINAAIEAGDLKKATLGDLRRAQSEIRHRIKGVEDYRRDLLAAGTDLRRADAPDFKKYLGDDLAIATFSDSYGDATKTIRRGATAGIAATRLALSFLERYLDFLEQWEEYARNGDTAGLEAAARASDKALATLNRRKGSLTREGDVARKLKRNVDQMARAASEDSQLGELISQLKKDYPKSFLAKHMVAKD